MLSREQAQALTRAIHLLRPAWDEEGIYAALAAVRDRDRFEVALAALRAAKDDRAVTPGVIPSSGSHWNELPAAEKPRATSVVPRKDEMCEVHSGSFAENCSGCRSDVLAGDSTKPADRSRPDGSAALAEARAAHAAATAGLCSHGVDRKTCKGHLVPAKETV